MLISRRDFVHKGCKIIGAVLVSSAALASNPFASARSHGASTTKVTWNALTTNGGGLSPGIDIADDGTKVCFTDSSGAYINNAGTWAQIASILNIPTGLYSLNGYWGMQGVAECRIAPGNSNYIYGFYPNNQSNNKSGTGFLCLSKNKGVSSDVTSYPPNTQVDPSGNVILGSNSDIFKRVQNKIGIDPNNENVAYAANPGGQPLVTFNAGKSFSNVPNLPVGTITSVGACCWQFDRSSGTTTRTINGASVIVTNTIYCTVEGSGAWQSVDGGASFQQISTTVGLFRPGYCSISSDGVYFLSDIQPNSASGTGGTGGVSSTTINITVNSGAFNPGSPITGTGIPGGTIIISTPPGGGSGNYTLSAAATVTNGTTVTVASSTGYYTLNRWQGGAWTIIWQYSSAPGNGITARSAINVAAHPTVNGTVCAMISGGSPHFLESSDYGTTWTRFNKTAENFTTPYADAPWYMAQQAASAFTTGSQQMMYDRSNPGQVYVNWGQGISTANVTVGVAPTWSGFTKGLEQAVCNMVVAESGVPVLQSVWDLFGFQHVNPSGLQTPPTNPFIVGAPILLVFGGATSIDPYDTSKQISVGYNALGGLPVFQYSINSGANWNACLTTPPTTLTNQNATPAQIYIANGVVIWVPAAQGNASFPGFMYRITWVDLVAGNPWTAIDRSAFNNGANFPATGYQGWGNSAVPAKHTLCFDRVNPSLVYAVCNLFQATVVKGMYVSQDAGLTWTYQGSSTDPAPSNGFNFLDIKAVPGIQGVLFGTVGNNGNQSPPDTSVRASLYKMTWDGVGHQLSIAPLNNIKQASYIGFGKAGNSGVATLFFAGFAINNLNYGIWKSENLGGSCCQLVSDAYGPWPIWNGVVNGIEGDKDVLDRVYVSTSGQGTVVSTAAA